jgi:type II secretory pathway pseudopilin PulG
MNPRHVQMRRSRRAFSLLEAVVVVLVLSISIPTTLTWTDAAVSRRADAVSSIRATAYASAMMESILADVSSGATGLGFTALADSAVYLDGPVGLNNRLAATTSIYNDQGMACSVVIGPLVNASGVSTGEPAVDLFRAIEVSVSFPLADGGSSTIQLCGMVTQW